jgi:tyrosine-protein phosphatase YwqE
MVIDMHSHILPGLDDGAADWEQAIAMARVAVNDGITEMVCTPHWVLGKYENDRKTVLGRFAEFEERLAAEKIPLRIHTGLELRIDTSIPNRLKTGELLTLNNGGVYVLLELPDENIPSNLHEFFWNLQISGYRPILSHVERNPIFRENPRRLFSLVENGILTQVTAASLLEGFVEEIRGHRHSQPPDAQASAFRGVQRDRKAHGAGNGDADGLRNPGAYPSGRASPRRRPDPPRRAEEENEFLVLSPEASVKILAAGGAGRRFVRRDHGPLTHF